MNKQKLKELVKTSLMKDEIDENKVYGPGELSFDKTITQDQKLISKAFQTDISNTKFDYKNNRVTFIEPISVKQTDGSDIMLGSIEMGSKEGFIRGYYDDKGNPIPKGTVKVPSKVNEDLDLGHEDNEPHMLKGDLYRIGKYAMELYQMVDEFEGQGEVDFPAWWQSMITDSKEKMVKAKHYLDFEIKEPSIDASLGVSTDEEPMMEGIEFKTNQYKLAHGKEPKGTGKWMFKVGDEEFSPSKSMSYADAKKEATKKAKEKKVNTITVLSESNINENEISAEEKLAGKIAKALKAVGNKDSSDQSNLKQARAALNKGNIDAAKKIAKPYIDEGMSDDEKERLSKLPIDQQLKIEKMIAMLKAEKKPKSK
jgi:hypothetical protein